MAWNEPGGGNKPNDPWGGGDQGPPDLDEALRKLQQRLGGLFGGRRGGSGGGGGGGGGGRVCRIRTRMGRNAPGGRGWSRAVVFAAVKGGIFCFRVFLISDGVPLVCCILQRCLFICRCQECPL